MILRSSWTSVAARRLGAAVLCGALPVAGAYGQYEVVHEGIRVDLTLDSLVAERPAGRLEESDPLAVQIRVTDAASGAAMGGLAPAAWLDLIPAGADDGADACKLKMQNFLGGSLFSAPAVSLSSFYVMALNAEPSLTVIDPLTGFGGSKLLALVELSSPGEDWALSRDGAWLYVSLPGSGRVAVVDTAVWRLAAEIETGGRPSRLLLPPDERYLWVADDDAGNRSGVAVVDTRRRALAARMPTGAGPHDLAVSDDGRLVFVSNQGAGTLSVLEADSLASRAEVATGPRPVSLAYSSLGRAVYVADAESGIVTVVDAVRHQVVARVQAEPGLSQVRFAPGGRLAFVVNPGADRVHVLDAASHRLVQTAEVEDEPDQVSFTDTLAYVHHRASETVLMFPLAAAGEEGRPLVPATFPGGQKPPGGLTASGGAAPPSLAAGIVRADAPTAVLVANPADRMVYYYKEGSAAPMGGFQNYGRAPRAALLVDRSLRETAAGLYETRARLAGAGAYDLALFVDAPRIAHCFRFRVETNPELERRRLEAKGALVEILAAPEQAAVGDPLAVRFRLRHPVTGRPLPGLRDVTVLAFLVPGIWQSRLPATEIGDGVYQVELTPGQPGSYRLQVEALSARLTVNLSPGLGIEVAERAAEPVRTP